jgi:hypothetical protein
MLASAASAQTPNDSQLGQIAADWAKRQERIQRVRYRIEGEVLMPRANLTDAQNRPLNLPGEPSIKAPFRWIYLIDFSTSRCRIQEDATLFNVTENRLICSGSLRSFDGTSTWGSRSPKSELPRKPTDPDLAIQSGDFRYARYDPGTFPMFYGHGIVPYAGSDRIYTGHLSFKPSMQGLYVHRQVVQEGRSYLVLRTGKRNVAAGSYDEVWVDLERESAVVRHARMSGDAPLVDVWIWYRKTDHGWLTDRWEQTIGWKKIQETKRARVEALDVDPAVTDADFRLEEKPGMLIKTCVQPPGDPNGIPPEANDVHYYRIDKKGKRREVVFEKGAEQQIEKP